MQPCIYADDVALPNKFQIRPDLGRIEKWVLRNAFDDEKNPYLPKVWNYY